MQYFVRAAFHLVQYSSSDNGHRTLSGKQECLPSTCENALFLLAWHPKSRDQGWQGVHSCLFPLVLLMDLLSLRSLAGRVWRQEGKGTGEIHGAQTGVRERQVFPPQPGSVYLYAEWRSQKDKSKIPAQVRDMPSPRCWQGRNWDPLQSSAGWVEHLSQ